MTMPPLPCPFCGSAKLNEEATGAAEIKGHTYQTGWIECRDCGCDGPSVELTDETPAQNDYQLVRDAWNRRAAIAAHVPEAAFGNIAGPAQAVTTSARGLLAAWQASANVLFVSRSSGQYTTDTVSRDDLIQLIEAAFAAAPQAVPALPKEPAPSTSKWAIEYQNDTGPDDGGFWEWWEVSDGEQTFKADSEAGAEMLLALLSARSVPAQPVAWLCSLMMEDGATLSTIVTEDPDGLRFNDDGEPSPYKVEPLYAAPQAVPAWQPIETAPKDGTSFLGWVAAERWSSIDGGGSGRSHDESTADFCWYLPERPDETGGYFTNAAGQIGDAQDITHWMPLPAAPSPKESNDE